MHQNLRKLLNVLSVLAIIILIATGIRTLVYWIIGLQTERVFRIELFIIWAIAISILIINSFLKKSNTKPKI